LVLGYSLIGVLEFRVISLYLLLVIVAKLPLFGLHIWLPKVHVEASLLRSVFLAAVILKARSVFYHIIGIELMVMLLVVMAVFLILSYIDGKGIVAISSVIHMSVTVLLISVVWISGYTHILVSSLIFLAVYLRYSASGSRLMWAISVVVLLTNLGFPFVGGFISEILLLNCSGLLIFASYYYLVFIFSVNLYYRGTNNDYLFLIFLLCILIL
jgi:formate hydrogenlyase subunit 3/multisubunit Na+/H+ antiporter MnhD subunit